MLQPKYASEVLVEEDKKVASSARRYEVTQSDLPLSCPMPDMQLWNAHPKVFLPIEKSGKATCPYCGSMYELKTNNKSDAG